MAQAHYNFAAALVAYAQGSSVESISESMAIPLTTLRNKVRTEGWARLANSLTPAVAEVPAQRAERDLERIAANRARNLAVAQRLQEDLERQVEDLLAGRLTGRRTLRDGTGVEHPAGLAERVQLANYAKAVADLSYRALGDQLVARETEVTPAGAGTITIVLPPQVSAPRPERADVVDLEPLRVTAEAPDVPSLPSEGSGYSGTSGSAAGTSESASG